jgi:hypothetical protein
MNQPVDPNIPLLTNQPDAGVVSLLEKMQQQLLFLEKKIDILIAQSRDQPFRGKPSLERPFRKRPVSKPFRSSGHSRSHGKAEQESAPREKDSSQKFYSRYRKRDENRGSSANKKSSDYMQKKWK